MDDAQRALVTEAKIAYGKINEPCEHRAAQACLQCRWHRGEAWLDVYPDAFFDLALLAESEPVKDITRIPGWCALCHDPSDGHTHTKSEWDVALLLEDRRRLIQERDRAIAGHERHDDGWDDIWDADIKAGRKEFASARLRELLHKCELEHRRVLHEFELSKSARDKQAKVEVQLFTRVEAAESEVARLKAVIAAVDEAVSDGGMGNYYSAMSQVRAALSTGNGEPA